MRRPKPKPAPRTSAPARPQPRPELRGKRRGPPPPPPERVLYGLNPVEAALEARRRTLERLYLKAGRPSERLARLRWLAQSAGVPVLEAAAADLELLGGSADHQGAVLQCGPLPAGDEAAALAVPPDDRPVLVALDQIEDPRNFGAIVRCCAAFRAAGVVVPARHRAPFSAAASKASAGTLERLPVYEVTNLARYLEAAKSPGYWIAGTVVAGGTPLPQFERDRPLVVVLGNEGRGVRPLVERQCDHLLSIPAPGGVSLNVSAAAAVLLYQVLGRTPAGAGDDGQ